MCFLFIAKSIAKLWLLLLPQADHPELLDVLTKAEKHLSCGVLYLWLVESATDAILIYKGVLCMSHSVNSHRSF